MKITDLRTTILTVPFARPTFWPYGRWDGISAVQPTSRKIEGLGVPAASPS